MFQVHRESVFSPLNQGQIEDFNDFCMVLKEYKVSYKDSIYYSDSAKLYAVVHESVVKNLQKTLESIDPTILNKISRLDNNHPLKFQLQQSLMALTECFCKLELTRKNEFKSYSVVEKKAIIKLQNQKMAHIFSDVDTFSSQPQYLLFGVKAFEFLLPRKIHVAEVFAPLNKQVPPELQKPSGVKLINTIKAFFVRAFPGQSACMQEPTLPPSVPRTLVRSASDLMPPPPKRLKKTTIQESTSPPRCLSAVLVSGLPEKPVVAALEEAPRTPPRGVKRSHPDDQEQDLETARSPKRSQASLQSPPRLPLQSVCVSNLPGKLPFWLYKPGTGPQAEVLVPESPQKPAAAVGLVHTVQPQIVHASMVLPAALQSPPRLPLQSMPILFSASMLTPLPHTPGSSEFTSGLEEESRTSPQRVRRSYSDDRLQEDGTLDSPGRPRKRSNASY